MTTASQTVVQPEGWSRTVSLLLNIAHGIDHMFLLIFATAVGSIAVDFGYANWEDLMPYAVGAFALFGLGALPAGRLGDLWGRRVMMIIFFVGIGVAALLTSLAQNAWQPGCELPRVLRERRQQRRHADAHEENDHHHAAPPQVAQAPRR